MVIAVFAVIVVFAHRSRLNFASGRGVASSRLSDIRRRAP
jgi:hypothetical protein